MRLSLAIRPIHETSEIKDDGDNDMKGHAAGASMPHALSVKVMA